MVERNSTQRQWLAPPIAAALASLALTACGSSSSSTSSSTATKTTSAPPNTTSAPPPAGGSSQITTGPVRGTLIGQNHSPTVGKKWPYAVTVRDAGGHPLNGTVDIEFVYAGQIVGRDTPPTHPVKKGRWHDLLTFPAAAIGQPLTFQAVVHTNAGSITLDWPIRVKN